MSEHQYCVYILTNSNDTVLYIGVTNDLERRLFEHKSKLVSGFTGNYNLNKLVYFEITTDVMSALEREKQLKRWSRAKKVTLIETLNPRWNDLHDEISGGQ